MNKLAESQLIVVAAHDPSITSNMYSRSEGNINPHQNQKGCWRWYRPERYSGDGKKRPDTKYRRGGIASTKPKSTCSGIAACVGQM